MEHPRLSKHDAMSSIEGRVSGDSNPIDESDREKYERLGHEKYFEENQRLEGLIREQVEVKNKDFNNETLRRLYGREGSKTDNYE